ncbi:MAG: tetratricopeptide repeat protein [Flavobacteriales bacterium]|jgi:tetratricopeptide (TPR) repeat protein|uniref:tetratricopeptide repeat protein n=1 Tax=Candidatus Ulvibacter alkanivorans TaxID=2267620 RepID=UPI000DF31DFF|nr:tetratricopeptide repeat protein [Candidatus Ulvibacter alkanivorans]MCH2489661.1 tetratricopeptide repeat protein [Flavobacteriales bacterium]
MRNRAFLLVLFFVSLLSPTDRSIAQSEADSILKKANRLIYENPDEAIKIASTLYNDPAMPVKHKISALLAISTAYSSKRDYEMVSQTINEIDIFFPQIKEEKQKINVLNRIGAQFHDLKIYDKAIEYLDEALLLIDSYQYQDSIQPFLGYNYIVRGFVYRQQMSCEIALTYFDKAIEAYDKTEENDITNGNMSVCYYNKGNCLINLDRIKEAETSFLLAIQHAERTAAPTLISFAQKGLAEIKSREGKYIEAINILNSALTNAELVGDLILNRGLYEGLSNNYLALNDWDNYLLYRNQYLALLNQTKQSERKTINQSMYRLTQTRAEEIEDFHTVFQPLQIGLLVLFLLLLFFLIRFVLLSEKKLKKLERTLKS